MYRVTNFEERVRIEKKNALGEVRKVLFQIHWMNTNPDPVTTRELSNCKRNFDQALKGMVEVGFLFLLQKLRLLFSILCSTSRRIIQTCE